MKHIALLLVLATLIVSPSPVLAQPSEEIQALRKAIDALRESQQRIEKDLGEIKSILRSPQAAPDDEPKNLVLTIDGPTKGERSARLVMVDFTDYQ